MDELLFCWDCKQWGPCYVDGCPEHEEALSTMVNYEDQEEEDIDPPV